MFWQKKKNSIFSRVSCDFRFSGKMALKFLLYVEKYLLPHLFSLCGGTLQPRGGGGRGTPRKIG